MNRRHRLRRPVSRKLMVWAAAALTLFLAASVLWAQVGQQQAQDEKGAVAQQRDQAAEQRDAAAAQAQQAVDPVLELCAQGDAVAQALRDRGACDLAKQVASTPVPPAAPLTGKPGRPPTAEEIQAAVDAHLLAHPPADGRPPTPAEVAAAVASYLTANPPTPGRPPTAEEISAAVAQWFADNPVRDGRDGEDGESGRPGRPPTDAEIDAAVSEWIAAHPDDVRGPPGKDGADGEIGCPAGTSLQPVEFASGETGLGCVDDDQSPPDDETEEPPVTTTTTPAAPTTGP